MNTEVTKNISIIGVGKLGLCFALNLERKEFNIIAVDKEEKYIEKLKNKSFRTSEKYVNEYLSKSKNIQFSTNINDALLNDIIFIIVSTPSTDDNKYDHSQINQIADALISLGKQKNRKDLIINCTTFPKYCDELHNKLKPYNYNVSYNPEFIAQGSIINDQILCDNVLIGQADEYSGFIIKSIYEKMVESKPVYNIMTRTEAELTKLAVNCFLTTKISYANMISDIAIKLECDSNKILQAVGTDSRIGSKYIKPGFGFGGPCFPRDNRALAKCGEEVGIDAVISKATDDMNIKHLEYQVDYFINKNLDKNKPVFIDYVTYKEDSVSIEESQQLKFAIKLKNLGYTIILKDQRQDVLEQLKNIL